MKRTSARHPFVPRREFLLQSAALGAALVMPRGAQAGELRMVVGEVAVNGRPANARTAIRALDIVTTGAGAKAIAIMGGDALLIRADSEVEILGKPGALVLTGLRMLTGALLGVFGNSGERQLLTATATIGIRGTGIYMEASQDQTYFCTCYGETLITDQHRKEERLVVSGYHAPNMIFADMQDGAMMKDAQFVNHTDDELVMLENLVGRRPPFLTT